jgi:hypothetical protein
MCNFKISSTSAIKFINPRKMPGLLLSTPSSCPRNANSNAPQNFIASISFLKIYQFCFTFSLWNKLMENMNFTHSSRSCWSLLRKLGAANETTRSKSNISPNSVASRLVNVSNSIKLNKREIRNMKRKLYKQRKSALTSEILSRPFSVEEMQEVGKTLKNRKAAGFDGIYPEFIKHLGPIGLNWLRSFFNDIVSTGKIPNEFKKAKVIAILKPGKPANEAYLQ